jgi:AAA15 family ATPase/GTPase
MLESVSIKRFRGFQQFEIASLDRFNLILGRNNTGKTALLEAIFLLEGPTNPELPLTLNALRGIGQFRSDPEELWGWLFYKKKTEGNILLEARTHDGKSRTLNITLEPTREIKKRVLKQESQQTPSVISAAAARTDLRLKYRDESNAQYVTRAVVRDTGIIFDREKTIKYPDTIFITANLAHVADNSHRWSKLEEVSQAADVIPYLKHLEPRLQRLAILVTGMGPIIHADIGIGRMVPLPFMGEGIGRVLTILLAIANCQNGIVLIDEFDNGLHYSVLMEAWRAVAEFSRKRNTQIIATSHSWECVRAAHSSFSETSHYDFRLHRLESANESTSAVSYDKNSLDAALETGVEVR